MFEWHFEGVHIIETHQKVPLARRNKRERHRTRVHTQRGRAASKRQLGLEQARALSLRVTSRVFYFSPASLLSL